MKNHLPYLYLLIPAAMAFAHGDVPDGHVEEIVAPNPEQRMTVLIAVAAIAVIFVGLIWYARSMNTGASAKKDEEKKTATLPSLEHGG